MIRHVFAPYRVQRLLAAGSATLSSRAACSAVLLTALLGYGCEGDDDSAWAAVLNGDAGSTEGDGTSAEMPSADMTGVTTTETPDGGALGDDTDLTDDSQSPATAPSSATDDGTPTDDSPATDDGTPTDDSPATDDAATDDAATDDAATDDGTPAPGETDDSTTDESETGDGSDTTDSPDETEDGTDQPAPSAGDSCAGRGYALCESFESTPVEEVPDGWQRLGDAVSVSDEHAHRGTKALRLGAVAQGERRISHDASMLTGTHWGRLHYRVEAVPDAFVHSTLVALDATGPAGVAAEYRPLGTVKHDITAEGVEGMHNWIFHVQRDPSSELCGDACSGDECVCEFGTETSYDWEFDGEWHCVEYYVDATNQEYRFFFDGAEHLSFTDTFRDWQDIEYEADLPSSYDRVKVGWNNYSSAPPGFEVYIDDVAFDHERIGCDD